MLGPRKARWLWAALPKGGEAMPATIAELTALSLLAPPCCGHIALCDGACRDARPGRRTGCRDLAAEDDPR